MVNLRRLAQRRDDGSPTSPGVTGCGERPADAALKLKQQLPSTSSGTLSAWACALGVARSGGEGCSAEVPTSSSRLSAFGEPTSAALTLMVTVHGASADGIFGHVTRPFSALPPELASG